MCDEQKRHRIMSKKLNVLSQNHEDTVTLVWTASRTSPPERPLVAGGSTESGYGWELDTAGLPPHPHHVYADSGSK